MATFYLPTNECSQIRGMADDGVTLAVGWYLDRSFVVWEYEKLESTVIQWGERLNELVPDWRHTLETDWPHRTAAKPPVSPVAAHAIGAELFGIATLLVIGVWQGRVHASVLKQRP